LTFNIILFNNALYVFILFYLIKRRSKNENDN